MSIELGILDRIWPIYIEMKARRDLGVHNGWIKNRVYEKKVSEVNHNFIKKGFLTISEDYFVMVIV